MLIKNIKIAHGEWPRTRHRHCYYSVHVFVSKNRLFMKNNYFYSNEKAQKAFQFSVQGWARMLRHFSEMVNKVCLSVLYIQGVFGGRQA